jgi:hypothetical protein
MHSDEKRPFLDTELALRRAPTQDNQRSHLVRDLRVAGWGPGRNGAFLPGPGPRSGSFCNAGTGEVAFTISSETLVGGEFGDGVTLEGYIRQIDLPSGGALCACLGLASDFADL